MSNLATSLVNYASSPASLQRLREHFQSLPLVAPAGTPEAVLKLLADEAVAWSNTDKAAKLRETFAIPNKPKNLAGTRKDWEGEVPVWIKLAVDLGIKLD